MKMTKKFLIGAVALVAAAMFTSCGIKNDNAETSGPKTNKDVEVDATSATLKYKRAVVQLGSLEQVQACTTTVRYPKAYDEADNVIGFIFDLNYNKDDKGKDISDSYNFVLVGYNPSTKKWYADHLENVSMKANNGEVKADALLSEKKEDGTEVKAKYTSWQGSAWGNEDKWLTGLTPDDVNDKKVDYKQIKFELTQDKDLTYTLKGNGTKLCTWTRTNKDVNTKDGKAQGGIAAYINAKKNNKLSGNWATEEVTGKLFADTDGEFVYIY